VTASRRRPPPPVLLDTCAALWLANGDPLSAGGLAAIRGAARQGTGIYLSPISAWEISLLAARGRLGLSMSARQWFDAPLGLPGFRLAELTADILIDSNKLGHESPCDPADRIVVATARALGAPVVTRDRQIIDYAKGGRVDVILC
jgi:PIN domain nuclease of toxin-antitoxin system